MTDTNRLQELAACLRAHAAYCQHEVAELTEAAAALDELRQIKEAALPEKLEEIAKPRWIGVDALVTRACARPSELTEQEVFELGGIAGQGINDRATLLASARMYLATWEASAARANDLAGRLAAEHERAQHLEQQLASAESDFEKLKQHATAERERLKGELEAKDTEIVRLRALHAYEVETGCAQTAAMQADADEARAKLGQCAVSEETLREQMEESGKVVAALQDRLDRAQKEIERLHGRIAEKTNEVIDVRVNRGDLYRSMQADLDGLRSQLSQAERDKAALRDGVLVYRRILHPCERLRGRESEIMARMDADEWHREHGALVPLRGEGSAAAVPSEGEAEKAPDVCGGCKNCGRCECEAEDDIEKCSRGGGCECYFGAADKNTTRCKDSPCPCSCHEKERARGAEILAAHCNIKPEAP